MPRPLTRARVIGWLITVTFAVLCAPAVASAASAPTLLGSVTSPSSGTYASALSSTESVAVSGNYAYTPAYYNGDLTAVDISNKSAPTITGEGTVPNTSPEGGTEVDNADTVTVVNGIAYVVSKNKNASSTSNDDGTGNALTLFDVAANPADPQYLGSISDKSTNGTSLFGAYGIAVVTQGSNTYALVAAQGLLSGQPTGPTDGGDTVDVIDVTQTINPISPAPPTLVATVTNPTTGPDANALDHPTAVAVSGNYAYVTSFYGNDLTVIDIANLANATTTPPTIAAVVPNTNNALLDPSDVAVSGNYAYVSDQNGSASSPGTMSVVNIANPTSPTIAGSVSAQSLAGGYRIKVHGNIADVAASSDKSITAVDVSNPADPQVVGTLLDATHLNMTTGLDLDSTGGYVVAASPFLTGQSNYKYPPFPPTGGTDTGTISVIQLDPAPIAVTIAPTSEPAATTTQTTAGFTFSANDEVATVLCSLDNAAYSPCTSPTTMSYTALAAGGHTFSVQVTDAAGNTNTATDTWTVVGPPSALTSSASPVYDNTPVTYTDTLTAPASGGSLPTGSVAFADGGNVISGCGRVALSGTSPDTATCTTTPSDGTRSITATYSGDSTYVSSEATLTEQVNPPQPPTATISAPAAQSQPYSIGQVVPTSFSCAEGAGGTGISSCNDGTSSDGTGALNTSAAGTHTYTVTATSRDSLTGTATLTYTVAAPPSTTTPTSTTPTSTTPTSTTPTSTTPTTTAPSITAPVNTAAPTISGPATAGQKLTASTGSWRGTSLTYSYRWFTCGSHGTDCSVIAGATHATYVLTTADIGHTLEVAVTATNAAGAVASTSKASPVITKPIVTTLALSRTQDLVTQGEVTAEVSCSTSASLGAEVKITIAKTKAFIVTSALKRAAARHRLTIHISLSAAERQKLKAAEAHHVKVSATVYGVREIGTNRRDLALTQGQTLRLLG